MKTQFYFPLLLLITLLLACLPQRPSPVKEPTATPESVSPPSIPTEAPTPIPPPTAVPLAHAIAATVPGSFAAYEPYLVEVEPSVQPYAVDLNSVANPDVLLTLSDEQRALLEQGIGGDKDGLPLVFGRLVNLVDLRRSAGHHHKAVL